MEDMGRASDKHRVSKNNDDVQKEERTDFFKVKNHGNNLSALMRMVRSINTQRTFKRDHSRFC